jgi:DyP dimeric alpha+beta barrel domain
MKKKTQTFSFFTITDVPQFKSALAQLAPRLTSTAQLLDVSTEPATAVNVAFSQTGLAALLVAEPLGDADFAAGQAAGASALGDPGTGGWAPAFSGAGGAVHGVLLLAAGSADAINATLAQIKGALGGAADEVYRLDCAARPGDQEGHERACARCVLLLLRGAGG